MRVWREDAGSVLRGAAVVLAAMLVSGTLVETLLAKKPSKPKPSLVKGAFVPVKQKLSRGRFDAMPVTLPDGRVLVAGGIMSISKSPPWATESVDVFTPGTGGFETLGPLAGPRGGGQTALLADGRILLIGGTFCCHGMTPMAEIYDPSSGTSEPLELSADIPNTPNVAPLKSGEILMVGGGYHDPTFAATLDPDTGEVTKLDAMPVGRLGGKTAAMPDGRILIFGGSTKDEGPQVQSVFFDPSDRSFRLGPRQNLVRASAATAVLRDGRVLVVGGYRPGPTPWLIDDSIRLLKSAEIFNPASGRFEATGRPIIRRFGGSATQLSDGRVLVTGGSSWVRRGSQLQIRPTLISEIYDPKTGKFTRTGDIYESRESASIVPLKAGRALLVGGAYQEDGDYYTWGRDTAEVFDPSSSNPKVRILKFTPKKLAVRINQKFRIKLLLRNYGKGVAREIRVCPNEPDWKFDELSCPTVRNLKPRKSKWVVVTGFFDPFWGEDWSPPIGPGSKINLEIVALGQGVNLYETVKVKIRK